MEILDSNEIWKYKTSIISRINIIDVIKEYGINPEEKSAGEFTHRIHCPFHSGKNGKIERTPSLFISTKTQSFCCFGCFKSGSTIEFISFMDGTPSTIALTKLAKRIGLVDKNGNFDELNIGVINYDVFEPHKTIDPILVKLSIELRNFAKNNINNEKELRWFNKTCNRVDDYLLNIGYEDYEYAENLLDKVKKAIKNRGKIR